MSTGNMSYQISLIENIERHAQHGRSYNLPCGYELGCPKNVDYFQAILDELKLLKGTFNED